MRSALRWLALDWDDEVVQSHSVGRHHAALDALAAAGRLYPCSCSRSDLQRAGTPALDGGWRYPGTCRGRALPPGGWRASPDALRLRLEPGCVDVRDEGGLALARDPFASLGDPILRRRDGAVAYHLAVVVDDAHQGITRVVRGRDLAPATAIHRVLQQHLGLPAPVWRHHLLLLEERGGKLAKLHGAVGWDTLRRHLAPEAVCGVLAHAVGLRAAADPILPDALLADFDWSRVAPRDRVMRWTGEALEDGGPAT